MCSAFFLFRQGQPCFQYHLPPASWTLQLTLLSHITTALQPAVFCASRWAGVPLRSFLSLGVLDDQSQPDLSNLLLSSWGRIFLSHLSGEDALFPSASSSLGHFGTRMNRNSFHLARERPAALQGLLCKQSTDSGAMEFGSRGKDK